MSTGISDDVNFPRIFELSLQPKLNQCLKAFLGFKENNDKCIKMIDIYIFPLVLSFCLFKSL